ncbi:MAG: LPS export ABC transporter periplasmic protein LptC [Sulfuricellaceae bacterium]
MMKDRLSIWFPVGLVFLLALLTFWLDRMVQPAGAKKDGSGRHDPDYWVENFTASRMGPDGVPKHVLTAGRMTHYPDDDSTELVRPHLTNFPPGAPPTHIEAQAGKVSSNGEQVWLTDKVKVTREAGRGASELTVTTDYLHVIPDKNFVQTDREVTMHNADSDVSAVGMELDGKTRIIKFLARVRGQHTHAPRSVADAKPIADAKPVADVQPGANRKNVEQRPTVPVYRQGKGKDKGNARGKTRVKQTHRAHRQPARQPRQKHRPG